MVKLVISAHILCMHETLFSRPWSSVNHSEIKADAEVIAVLALVSTQVQYTGVMFILYSHLRVYFCVYVHAARVY